MHYNPNYQAIPGASATQGDTNYLVTEVITTAGHLRLHGLTHTHPAVAQDTAVPWGRPRGWCGELEELNYG